MNTHKSPQSGFTLIELMIVVAIIGILAAIAVPQVLRFSSKSKRSEGLAILNGLHQSELVYYSGTGKFPVYYPTAGFPPSIGYALMSPAKFYFIGTLTPPSPEALGDEDSYVMFLAGQLDGDENLDYLCIGYPETAAAICGPGVEPGVVTVAFDDVND